MPSVSSSLAYHKRNLYWPMSRRRGGMRQASLLDRLEVALFRLMNVKRGSYYSDPEYGSTIYRLRTQGLSEGMREVVYADLQQSVAKYIPDIVLYQFTVVKSDEDQSLTVSVTWGIRGATEQQHGELAKKRITTTTV